MEPLVSGFYTICVWVFRFAYLNILWLLFTLLGAVVLGFFPATIAMFAVERKWILGDSDFSIFQHFWSTYKQEFIKINLLGYAVTFIGALLVINYFISTSLNNAIGDMLGWLLLGLLLLCTVAVIYIFPVYVHYDVKYLDYIKHAFVIGISSPLMSLLILLSFMTYFYIVTIFPGILPLYTGSMLSFAVMWFAHCAFIRIESKQIKRTQPDLH
ncbi:Uncharacterized membrane protein YesL [Terribacillus aidingensis]|uniref:Uncharacterized membrane protein YesL n=1 Tax=Terribacillus aidingensis TaxID=586416 RepID=A0A285P6V3_9BACI|nr:YesL family protein [Terribacillus aidingensis]SNZ17479.1 Uncharacterized membrane protein YesL [Terribacillus aidingensis]